MLTVHTAGVPGMEVSTWLLGSMGLGSCLGYAVLGALLLIPGLILMTAAELIAFVACAGACVVAVRLPREQPLPTVLRSVVSLAVPPCCRVLLFSVGFWCIRVRGKRDSSVRLVISNHACICDGFVLTAVLSAPSFLARSEGLERLPMYSTILRAMQLVFVDRTSPASRTFAAAETSRRLLTDQFPPLVVFPEGTTNNGATALLPFRRGAFAAAVPCQPVVIRYPNRRFRTATDGGGGVLADLRTIIELLFLPYTCCEVTFLPVFGPTGRELVDPLAYAESVRAVMQRVLVPNELTPSTGGSASERSR